MDIARLRRVPRGVARRARRSVRLIGARWAGPAPSAQPAAGPAVAPNRRDLVLAHVNLAGHGLEIGPSHRPLVAKRDGYDIAVADHLDQAGLIAKYSTHATIDVSGIEGVDFVLSGPQLTATIHDTFDYILASHLLEHTVCLITFLQECEALLKPGGVVAFALPDKRWCFDRYRERSPLGRVIDVSYSSDEVHTPGTLAEYNLSVVSRGGIISWSPTAAPGDYRFVHGLPDARAVMQTAGDGIYRDVHNWVFTPHHFRLLMHDLYDLGFIKLREVAFHDTVGMEFFATLGVQGEGSGLSRADLVLLADAESGPPDSGVFIGSTASAKADSVSAPR